MQYRQLGNSDLSVSVVGLGGNTFGPPRIDEAMTHRVIHAAMDMGINFVDTAIGYGEGESEKYIGTALAGGRRDKMVVATKLNLRNLGDKTARQAVRENCETSLSKLQTDYIDLLQIHQPNREIEPDELLRAFDDLIQEGKVREIGACNYASWQMSESMFTARTLGTKSFISAQNHYNLLRRQIEAELTRFCAKYGVSIIPYFPLGGGFLTGKYRRNEPPPEGTRGAAGSGIIKNTSTDRNWEILPGLEDFATERGHSIGELAVAWLIANPAVGSVITGVSNVEQVTMNAKAAEWVLTPEEKSRVDGLSPREGDDEGQPVGARAALGVPNR
jgi:aryl-alcohol dehydrogenase-like predicted oxidoreductase